MNNHSVGDSSREHQFLTASKSRRFLEEFDLYLTIYEKLESQRKRDLRIRLLDIGKQVRCGTRSWVREDLDDIACWRRLQPHMLVIDSVECEERLKRALMIENESLRVSALCDIRGIGPVLASTLLTFTWPESYGFIDYHAWNALRYLSGEFPRKYSDSAFSIAQLLTYLKVVRNLGGSKAVSSMEIAEALYALDSARTKDNWKGSLKSLVPQFPTMVDVGDGF